MELLKESNLRGYVLEPIDNFIPMLVQDENISELKPSKTLVAKNKGLLIHISNCEDFGFEFNIF